MKTMQQHPKAKRHRNHKTAAILCLLVSTTSARLDAHTSYGGTARDLGPGPIAGTPISATQESPYSKTISSQTVTSDFGWISGTLPEFGDAHHIRAFRFTLALSGHVSILAEAAPSRGTATQPLIPAFTLYAGLLNLTGGSPYDTAPATLAYLAGLGDPQPRAGALNSLGDVAMANDAGDFSNLSYLANAADGTADNLGSNPAITSDGNADGKVAASYLLAAGDYTLFVGGANLAGIDEAGTYGVDVTLTAIPEPGTALLTVPSGLVLLLSRRRNTKPTSPRA